MLALNHANNFLQSSDPSDVIQIDRGELERIE